VTADSGVMEFSRHCKLEHHMQFVFPVHLLIDTKGMIVTLPANNGDKCLIFSSSDEALAFAAGLGIELVQLASVPSAIELSDIIERSLPDGVSEVWMNQKVTGERTIEFTDRFAILHFLMLIQKEAGRESKADQN